MASYRIRFGHSIQAYSSAGIDVLGTKMDWQPHRIVSEILQESLGILVIKNRIHIEWGTNSCKKEAC